MRKTARQVVKSYAGRREAVGTGFRWESFLRGVVMRVSAGAEPQPWWMPRRVLTVVSADVDDKAGVGALWLEWRPKSPRMREHLVLLEWYGERWRYVGGGSGSGDDPVDVDVLDVCNGAGALSLTRGHDLPHSLTTAPWIGCAKVRLGRNVSHVLIGDRRIEVPERRTLIAAWTSPPPQPRTASRHRGPGPRRRRTLPHGPPRQPRHPHLGAIARGAVAGPLPSRITSRWRSAGASMSPPGWRSDAWVRSRAASW